MSHLLKNSVACLLWLTLLQPGFAREVDGKPAAANATEVNAEEASAKEVSAKELSVAPLDHVEYPESRPAWMADRPAADDPSFRAVVVSGPCDSPEESAEELRLMQRAAVSNLVTQIAPSDGRFDFYRPSDDEIERDLVRRRYAGEVIQGDQTRYEHAVEIEFSEAEQQRVLQAWQAQEVRHRLGAMGVMTFSGLVLLICGSAAAGMFSRRVQRRDAREAVGNS